MAAGKRDFGQVTELVAGVTRTNTSIQAAQQFALVATQAAQHPPHNAAEWEEINNLWVQAIDQLKRVPAEDPGYVDAQKLLANYQRNMGIVHTRLQAEQTSVTALTQAKDKIASFLTSFPTDAATLNRNQLKGQLQSIIDELHTVQPGTTVYPETQALLQSAQKKLKQLQPK